MPFNYQIELCEQGEDPRYFTVGRFEEDKCDPDVIYLQEVRDEAGKNVTKSLSDADREAIEKELADILRKERHELRRSYEYEPDFEY